MKSIVTVVCTLLAVGAATSAAPVRSREEPLYSKLTNEVSSVSVPALERVLKTPEDFSADILYVSCIVALREKRLEDEAFLFHIAPFRAKFDQVLFPPVGTGANDPMLAFVETKQMLGRALNAAIMLEPKTFARALARVKTWKPRLTAGYAPWWEYAKKTTEKQAVEAIENDRKEFMQFMNGLCTLLQDDAYFGAFRTAQGYNLKPSGDTNRPLKSAYDAALRTLEKIEKEKGIDGISSLIKK